MMPPVEIVASRMRRRASGSLFLTEMDIAEIIRDFTAVNDPVQLYDLVSEITCVAAFFNAGDGAEIARVIMQRVVPAVASRAAQLSQMMRGGTAPSPQRMAKTKTEPPRYNVGGALAEPTRIIKPRRHET